METSVRNLKGKRNTVAKMCCLVQRAIFILINYNPTSPILLDTVPYIDDWRVCISYYCMVQKLRTIFTAKQKFGYCVALVHVL